ncbi:MAG: HEPN domain-containing protein [Candidatus Baldrarchaeia archaeon]
MSSASRYKDWFSEAEDDFKAALLLKEGKMYGKACFFAQQAAKKALKALLLKLYKTYEDTHSVMKLLSKLSGFLKLDDKLRACAQLLDRHYLPPRYPNMWPSGAPHEFYNEGDAEEAIDCARRILELVRRHIT